MANETGKPWTTRLLADDVFQEQLVHLGNSERTPKHGVWLRELSVVITKGRPVGMARGYLVPALLGVVTRFRGLQSSSQAATPPYTVEATCPAMEGRQCHEHSGTACA